VVYIPILAWSGIEVNMSHPIALTVMLALKLKPSEISR
jgi:Cu/Ag efflux pump CusA